MLLSLDLAFALPEAIPSPFIIIFFIFIVIAIVNVAKNNTLINIGTSCSSLSLAS